MKIGDFVLIKNRFMKRIGLIWWYEKPMVWNDPNNPWYKARKKEHSIHLANLDMTLEKEIWEENLKKATHSMPETMQ